MKNKKKGKTSDCSCNPFSVDFNLTCAKHAGKGNWHAIVSQDPWTHHLSSIVPQHARIYDKHRFQFPYEVYYYIQLEFMPLIKVIICKPAKEMSSQESLANAKLALTCTAAGDVLWKLLLCRVATAFCSYTDKHSVKDPRNQVKNVCTLIINPWDLSWTQKTPQRRHVGSVLCTEGGGDNGRSMVTANLTNRITWRYSHNMDFDQSEK